MSDIHLKLNKRLFSPTLFPLLLDNSKRWMVFKGSAGSGKSYFLTQKIIVRCCQEPIRVLVCRRYGTTIRNTCFALFKEVLDKWQLTNLVKIRETDYNIKFPNGSEIIFTGLDEESKLLSLTNITVIFVEEAYEVPYEIVEQLNLRLRGGRNQQLLLAFNPISKRHWLYDFCVEHPPQSFIFSETTYKDNPFLSAEYVAAIEELKERNPAKWKIYGLGEWGVPQEGLVFTNWHQEIFNPMELAENTKLEHRTGSDLGFVDATTIITSLYDRENKTIYVYDEFYKSGCQLDEIYDAFIKMRLNKTLIYMDAAEPRSIQYFRNKGLNVKGSIKGADSVKAGILFLQNHHIIVHPNCKHLIEELENFSYIKDKNTGEYTEKTTHEYSHAIDGLRYAYSDIYTGNRLRTLDKSILGL